MNLLREQGSVSARALEFTILTACRTSEVLGARWEEIDLEAKVWTVPASRMKMRREHRVPLSDRAMQILHEMQTILLDSGGLVFPGQRQGKPLSNMSFLMLLRRLGQTDITPHGFRSSFRDWAGNETHFPRETCEKRRVLMEKWAEFCEG
jgi:integrase